MMPSSSKQQHSHSYTLVSPSKSTVNLLTSNQQTRQKLMPYSTSNVNPSITLAARSKLMMVKSKTSHELKHQNDENKEQRVVVEDVVNMSVNNSSFLSAKNDSLNVSSGGNGAGLGMKKRPSNNNILKASFTNNPNNMSISNDNLTFGSQNVNFNHKASGGGLADPLIKIGKKEYIDCTYFNNSVLKNSRISASKYKD